MIGQPLRIDAHLHLWNRQVSDYLWLTPDMGAVYANWSPEQAAAELSQAGMTGAVLVQAEDSRIDTEYLLGVAAEKNWVLGVVGWVALDDLAATRRDLESWLEQPAFCGVRHLINNDLRADFLDQPAVRASLAELSKNELPFDVHDAWPRHLDQAERLAADLPDLTLVIDHLGKPPRSGDDFGHWRDALARLAAHPNTVAKLSGLHDTQSPYAVADIRRVLDIALELFGPERLMYGGDWPMTVPSGGYQTTWENLNGLIEELHSDEQMSILSGTATRVYQLEVLPADLTHHS
jgi:L-fuconolactonase